MEQIRTDRNVREDRSEMGGILQYSFDVLKKKKNEWVKRVCGHGFCGLDFVVRLGCGFGLERMCVVLGSLGCGFG